MKRVIVGFSVGMMVLLGMRAIASDCAGVCSQCGCDAPTRKICRVVEDVKKTSKTSYSCECEDFCIPGKSDFCGYKTECGPCGETKCKKVWKPTCGESAKKTVLMKTVTPKETKTHKYEVIEVCDACAGHGRCRSCNDGGCNHGASQGGCRTDCAKVKQPAVPSIKEESVAVGENPPVPESSVETVSFLRKTLSAVKR